MTKTCKTCKHFSPDTFLHIGFGDCDMIADSNAYQLMPDNRTAETNKVYAWDYEGYSAGAYVGENFGCIHWEKK